MLVYELLYSQQFFLFRIVGFYIQRDVRAVERRNEHLRIPQSELSDDIITSQFVGSSRERHKRYVGEILLQYSQPRVLRTEIMSPLRNTVSLINSNQADIQRIRPLRHFGKQPFGRHIKQFDLSCKYPLHNVAVRSFRLHAVKCRSRNTIAAQRVHLVLHQGQQRRNDNGTTVLQQRRNLITDRLPAACRHKDQRIAAPHNLLNDLILNRTEAVESVKTLQQLQCTLFYINLILVRMHSFLLSLH